MTVREYIGARYVPLFIGDWDNTVTYEPLSIVQHQGNSYTSRQYVPTGIDIANEAYWAPTGTYNAQIDAYRAEVQAFDGRIDSLEAEVSGKFDANGKINSDLVITASVEDSAITTQKIADGAVTHDKIATGAVSSNNILDGSIAFADLDATTQQRILNNNVRYSRVVFIGDSYGRGVGGTDDHGWAYYTAQYLNLTSFLNVSNSGAGFVAQGHSEGLTGMTFYDQIAYASENLPSGMTTETVDVVVIAGGYNDHGQSGLTSAVKNTVQYARQLFPNAKICVLPLCTGDRELDASYYGSFHSIVSGAAEGGAATSENSIYWLYPYEFSTSHGDHIHPNDDGYKVQGRNIASFILGADITPYATTLGASAEGYSVAENVTVNGFRCGVTMGTAWATGTFARTGWGSLFTLPSYLRPTATQYILAFAYADSSHQGPAKIKVNTSGLVEFYDMLPNSLLDNSKTYTISLPFITQVLGHEWR